MKPFWILRLQRKEHGTISGKWAQTLQLIIVKTRFRIGTMLCSDLLQIQDIRERRLIAFSILTFSACTKFITRFMAVSLVNGKAFLNGTGPSGVQQMHLFAAPVSEIALNWFIKLRFSSISVHIATTTQKQASARVRTLYTLRFLLYNKGFI